MEFILRLAKSLPPVRQRVQRNFTLIDDVGIIVFILQCQQIQNNC